MAGSQIWRPYDFYADCLDILEASDSWNSKGLSRFALCYSIFPLWLFPPPFRFVILDKLLFLRRSAKRFYSVYHMPLLRKKQMSIVLVLWVIETCSLANIYRHLEEASFLYIHKEYCLILKNEALRFSEVTVTFHESTLCNLLEILNLRRHGCKKFKSRTTDFFTQNVSSAIVLNRTNKSGTGD
jgi:hypothetical protein